MIRTKYLTAHTHFIFGKKIDKGLEWDAIPVFTPITRLMPRFIGLMGDFTMSGQEKGSIPGSMAYKKMLLKK